MTDKNRVINGVEYITATEVAELFGVTAHHIRSLTRGGKKLPSKKILGRWVYNKIEVMKLAGIQVDVESEKEGAIINEQPTTNAADISIDL